MRDDVLTLYLVEADADAPIAFPGRAFKIELHPVESLPPRVIRYGYRATITDISAPGLPPLPGPSDWEGWQQTRRSLCLARVVHFLCNHAFPEIVP